MQLHCTIQLDKLYCYIAIYDLHIRYFHTCIGMKSLQVVHNKSTPYKMNVQLMTFWKNTMIFYLWLIWIRETIASSYAALCWNEVIIYIVSFGSMNCKTYWKFMKRSEYMYLWLCEYIYRSSHFECIIWSCCFQSCIFWVI